MAKKRTRRTQKQPAAKWDDTHYVTAYQLAKDGAADKTIAKTLGVSDPTFRKWRDQRPALGDALDRARKANGTGLKPQTFQDYVYDHLSPELRDTWDRIMSLSRERNGVALVQALLADHGKRARQHLFLYALTQSMFNTSAAMRRLGLSRRMYNDWVCNDPDFAELVDELHWHKENFFESALIQRVVAGDTSAILHAVKTQCKDRGYNDKVTVEHTGQVASNHQVEHSLADLDLPLDVRRQVLQAMRARQAVLDGTNN